MATANLLINIAADVKKMSKNIDSLGAKFKKLDKVVSVVKKGMVAFAGVAAAREIAQFVQNVANTADAVGKLSQRLGISTQFINKFQFAAEKAGVNAATTELALQRLTRRMGEIATTGKSEALPALEKLGGGLAEMARQGASVEEIMPLLVKRLNMVGDATSRAALTMKLFDSEGVKLVQLIGQSEKAYTDAMRAAEKFGAVMSEDLIKSSSEFNDNLLEMKTNLAALGRDIVGPVIKKFNLLASAWREFRNFGLQLGDLFNFGTPAGLSDDEEQRRIRASGGGRVSLNQNRPGFVGPREAPQEQGPGAISSGLEVAQQALTSFLTEFDNATLAVGEGIITALTSFDTMADKLQKRSADFFQASKDNWLNWAAEASNAFANVSFIAFDMFQNFSDGFGDVVAQAIVFGEDFKELFSAFMKNLAASFVSALVSMLIQLAVAKLTVQLASASVYTKQLGESVSLAASNAYASTAAIPIIGPALAPAAAAAAAAGAAAAAISGYGTGTATGAGLSAAGAAGGGFTLGEGLVMMHPNELIANDQQLKEIKAGGSQVINLIVGKRTLTRAVLEGMPSMVNLRMGTI